MISISFFSVNRVLSITVLIYNRGIHWSKINNAEKYFEIIYVNKMDNHKEVIKLCGVCGNKRMFNDYHRLYNPCKICAAKIWAPSYQAERDKIIAISNLCQENRENKKIYTQHIKELNRKVEELTRAMETSIWKKNRFLKLSKCLSLTIHFVNFVKHLLQKNTVISIFFLIDICIENWMVIGQHIFNKDNWLKMKILYLKRLSGQIFLQLEIFKE